MIHVFRATVPVAAFLAFVAPARSIEFGKDTFAFSNDTFWAYADDGHGGLRPESRPAPPPYTRHCLVLVRAALQFHRFAAFRPAEPPLPEPELRARLKRLARIPAGARCREKIIFPGFPHLAALSRAHKRAIQDTAGLWWPTYWRPGNWRMAQPFPRAGQEKLAADLRARTARGEPVALFLTRFRPMNHAVIALRQLPATGGRDRWECYDPNSADRPLILEYHRAERAFHWPRTAYWPGGRVNAFEIYRASAQPSRR